MFRKIILAAVLALSIIVATFGYISGAVSSMPSGIYVNEREISTDVRPFIENGTTFVPVRSICNALRIGDIQWNDSNSTVTIKAENEIQFTVGEKYAFVNGKKYVLSAPTVIREGRTMIPVRLLAEAFGAYVEWDKTLYCVEISKDGLDVPSECVASGYTKGDLLWLSRIVHAESVGEPFDGQLAVANVVLNRVASNEYPNTIYGVIFDRKYGVQFQPVANGTVYNTPSKLSVMASKRAMMGENNIGNCLYFLNESIATSSWITENREYYAKIHNHSFYV